MCVYVYGMVYAIFFFFISLLHRNRVRSLVLRERDSAIFIFHRGICISKSCYRREGVGVALVIFYFSVRTPRRVVYVRTKINERDDREP